jgi:exonuclease I
MLQTSIFYEILIKKLGNILQFAFYEFETTGTSPAFDQSLQFAAILTDDDFNEIERVNLRCRLAPHCLTSAPMGPNRVN